MSGYRRKILVSISLIIVALGGAFVFYFYSVFFFSNTSFEEPSVEVYIRTSATFSEVRQQIKPYLKSLENFTIVANKKGYVNRIASGKFELLKGMNNNEIINVLRNKDKEVLVKFNNQERIQNLAGRVASQIEADSISLMNAFLDPIFLEENGFDNQTAICMYLPNSYQFYWDTNAIQFRDRMSKEYRRYWNKERIAKAEALGLSPCEVITLAAIVQKESYKTDEQPIIAGVYLNRLEKRIRLQADPTVIYALKDSQDDFDLKIRRVLRKDLKIKNPYNTYKNYGLPPGPISMPSLSAINAVLNPQKHSYIYFVADPKNRGYHLFSTTLKEHNKKRRYYIDWINSQKIYR